PHPQSLLHPQLAGTHHHHPLRLAVFLWLRGIPLPWLDQDLADQVSSLARLLRPLYFCDGHCSLLHGHNREDYVQRRCQIQEPASWRYSWQSSWLLSLAVRPADCVLGSDAPVPKATPARGGAAAAGSASPQQLMKVQFSAVELFFSRVIIY
ncbi:hypothetical protein TNCT_267571, partial [Trichonephila clavata]